MKVLHGAQTRKKYTTAGGIKAAEPTRLFIDARSTAEWRVKGFSPVLNEAENDPELNLDNSAMYKMLRLKQLNPQPRVGMLPDSFTLELDREQTCPKTDTFAEYADEHPLWGMPYAMPNLNGTEYDMLVQWLAQGAPPSEPLSPSVEALPQIERWEAFLNGASLKEQLMSRYLYEHLFLAHIHLADTPPREFYRLVRSVTPPGQPVNEIATPRPFNEPGTAEFYYRLIIYQPSIVAKDHLVYEFSPARIDRYRALFLEPDYQVTEMPPYDLKIATNPFKTFRAMPPNARYRFMLDDARFFINGFIKGPVCRGQTALNVIDDQFWVVFFDPDKDIFTENSEFLDQVADDLQMPAEWGDSTLKLFKAWTEYWAKQKRYLAAKEEHIVHMHAVDNRKCLELHLGRQR